jgi:hypothetical protein
MSYVMFVARCRDELIADLRMMTSIACPKCAIHYVDNEQEDACRTDCCQYEFEAPTSDAEILREWKVDVLREMYRTEGVRLFLKWADRFGCRFDKERLLDMFHYHHIYPNYDLEELSRILDALAAANARIEHPSWWRNRMTEREYALLCSHFTQ